MLKKTTFLVIVVALLQLFPVSDAPAQTPTTCYKWFIWYWPDPLPTGTLFCGLGQGPYSMMCYGPSDTCAPAAAPQETGTLCPKCAGGSPVSFASGDTYIEQTDIRIPGLAGGLTLHRTWTSLWPSTQTATRVGMFGANWRTNFEESVFPGSDGTTKYSRGDGKFWSYGTGSGPNLLAPQLYWGYLTSSPSNWTITFQNGEQRLFSTAFGKLTAIIDRNGNTTQLSYDGALRLATVTDPAGRHLYFSYGSNGLVSQVTSDVGLTVSYAYDNQNRLWTVTKPDSTTISFQYDSNSYITSVLDSDGKVLESHTYDSSGRGLSSSQAGGVNAVTFSYPQ